MNIDIFIKKHSNFPLNSRLWVYPANRIINENEIASISVKLNQFIQQWEAHGTPLKASFGILYQTFIVLIVDETIEPASGCSIDKSVRFIKAIGNELQINFFERETICYLDQNEIKHIALNNLAALDNEFVFDVSVANLNDLKSHFLLPFAESRLNRIAIQSSFIAKL